MFNLVQDLKLDKEIKMVETNTQDQQEPFAVFERGDRGEGVKELQQKLADQGFDVGDVDGIYGGKTQAAALEYQRRAGNLNQTGVFDGATYNALMTREPVTFGTPLTQAQATPPETTPVEQETSAQGLPSNIDFGFIAQQEGDESSMYIPMENGSAMDSSGPTIGMGVDFGQKSPRELEGLPQGLRTKLEPYTNMRGQEAVNFVRNNPLTLSGEERQIVNAWSKQAETSRVISLWERDSDIPWSSLTPQQATAVASVMYQYGSYRVRTPSFWRAATSGDWAAVERELRNFGDSYGARRRREANYLTSR
jgi:peptidoglycan hydrolase-like protein with peptidoglycan-binding domain